MNKIFGFLFLLGLLGCKKDDPAPALFLESAFVGSVVISINDTTVKTPVDRSITLNFSHPLNPVSLDNAILLYDNSQPVQLTLSLINKNKSIVLFPADPLKNNSIYHLEIKSSLKGASGEIVNSQNIVFKTIPADLKILSFKVNDQDIGQEKILLDVPKNLNLSIQFSAPVQNSTVSDGVILAGSASANLKFDLSENGTLLAIQSTSSLQFLSKYELTLTSNVKGINGESLPETKKTLFTQADSTYKFPRISDQELLDLVQYQTFKYFWDFAHPESGLIRERNTSGNLVTIGGSGFGVMAILVGIERGFITRKQGVNRLAKIVDFLAQADRFHGVWPHWMNGTTGETIPFSAKDDGGDIVETAFMVQGLLTVRQYLDAANATEKTIIDKITQLWETVEWDWYTQGENVIYWHWSPNFGFEKNLPVRGWNEALIVYVLAAASPTFPVDASVYHQGWARNGAMKNGNSYYGVPLPLGNAFGGPLFFSHYSFLGLDPRNLKDHYADYWTQQVNHSKINQLHAVYNPNRFAGYNEACWGFTASDNHQGYSAHSPTRDLGVITPTAALSSIPYTPELSLQAMRTFYYILGNRLWGPFGFYDAFNPTQQWYASSYLAIDQGPIVIMIENYRSGLLWNNFMKNTEIKKGLTKLGFNY